MTGAADRAVARSRVRMQPATAAKVRDNELRKGDVLGVAVFAGVQAAKGIGSMLPSVASSDACAVDVALSVAEDHVDVVCEVTGADPERAARALAGATAAALAVYDMCKAVDKQMVLEDIGLD